MKVRELRMKLQSYDGSKEVIFTNSAGDVHTIDSIEEGATDYEDEIWLRGEQQ